MSLNVGSQIDGIRTKNYLIAEVLDRIVQGFNNLARSVANISSTTTSSSAAAISAVWEQVLSTAPEAVNPGITPTLGAKLSVFLTPSVTGAYPVWSADFSADTIVNINGEIGKTTGFSFTGRNDTGVIKWHLDSQPFIPA